MPVSCCNSKYFSKMPPVIRLNVGEWKTDISPRSRQSTMPLVELFVSVAYLRCRIYHMKATKAVGNQIIKTTKKVKGAFIALQQSAGRLRMTRSIQNLADIYRESSGNEVHIQPMACRFLSAKEQIGVESNISALAEQFTLQYRGSYRAI